MAVERNWGPPQEMRQWLLSMISAREMRIGFEGM